MVKSLLVGTIVVSFLAGIAVAAPETTDPERLAGTWSLSVASGHATCRILLSAQTSDRGDYFLGLPPACRHSFPTLATIGRWSMPDARHVTLSDPAGVSVLTFAGNANAFTAIQPDGTSFKLEPVALVGRSAAEFKPLATAPAEMDPALIEPVARRRAAPEAETPQTATSDIPGRYAVMRDKRDTGCMLTLDSARVTGGARAQLAPGCRDQGIVVFDPTTWQIVKGELVLTAKAGHKARLAKDGEVGWVKDPKEGGKPLGLKKL